ncbi:hypothetical protein, partial [uncultured Rothia sp.]|uniref:hypothetical protein n=1 Tax=uncultured Rothia sp. TaxID=316088 RepID=UPI0026361323
MAKVGIRVYPDTSRFRGDLKRSLDRIEKSTTAKVTVVPVLDRKAMGRLQHALNGLTATVSVDVNIQKALHQLDNLSAEKVAKVSADADVEQAQRALKKLDEARKCTVNADADTGAAAAKLGALARPRVAVISPVINSSAAATAASALAALSGGRVLSDAVSNVREFASNLDRLTPRIAATGAALASMSSVGIVAAQNIAAVGASLVSIGPAALALPGIISGFLVGVASSADGLQNILIYLDQLSGKFGGIRDMFVDARANHNEAFWGVAKAGLAELYTSGIVPFFAEYQRLGEVSGAFWGNFFRGMSQGITA